MNELFEASIPFTGNFKECCEHRNDTDDYLKALYEHRICFKGNFKDCCEHRDSTEMSIRKVESQYILVRKLQGLF